MSLDFWRRIWHLVNRKRFEQDLTQEMREHRKMMADPKGFGDPYRLLEASRDAWGWNWLDDAAQDLKIGARTLRRSPVFTITATLILAFGIGLNLTLYQLASVGLMSPPAVRSPETLAQFYRVSPNWNSSGLPYVAAQFVKEQNTALSAVLLQSATTAVWGRDTADQIEVSFISPNWFSELGYGALSGRVFAPGIDGLADASPAVVVSHEFWQTKLGADPAVVGKTVYVNLRPATLVGIAPPAFPGLDMDRPSMWMPINQHAYYFPDSPFLRTWKSGNTAIYGRLRDGLSPAAARESLRVTMGALAQARPDDFKKDEWLEPFMATVNFMTTRERSEVWFFLSLLGGLTGLVLVVAAANIGNLVLSRATGRARELGVRIALGARRSRIVRQLLMETLPLGVLGAVGGLVFAAWTAKLVATIGGLPPYLDFTPDWRSIVVNAGLSVLAIAVVAVLPAWKVAQQELVLAIKDGGQQVSLHLDRARIRRTMLAAQVAGSCLILAIAGMTTRTVQRVRSSDLGFEYEQVLVLDAKLGNLGVSGTAARNYWNGVAERMRANSAASEVAVVTAPPLGGRVFETGFGDAPGLEVLSQSITPTYFALMEIPIIAGRTFAAGDPAASTAIVSRALALRMYGTTDVLGRGFPVSEPVRTIIGIAADAHSLKVTATNVAELYQPLAAEDYNLVYLLARARGDAAELIPAMREAARLDPRVLPAVRLMRNDFDLRMRGPRLSSGIALGVGLITLVLACLGIFGVVSYGVALRTKEIGIHLALGARQSSIVRLVMRHVLSPVGVGVLIGLAAAVPAGRALSSEPLYLRSVDPVVYVLSLAAFVTAGGLAALLPAVRVLRTDPIRALRHD